MLDLRPFRTATAHVEFDWGHPCNGKRVYTGTPTTVRGIYYTHSAFFCPVFFVLGFSACCFHYLRGTIVNRTYGTHKNLHIYLFLLTIVGPIYCGPP